MYRTALLCTCEHANVFHLSLKVPLSPPPPRVRQVRGEGMIFDDGGIYDSTGGSGLALVRRPSLAAPMGYSVDSSAGRFSASPAVGMAGHMENFFLAAYLRDFNRIVPLTSESSVTEGMLEVLSPTVSSRGLATPSPIKQPESRRQAKLAVFWGVVAMGSRILGASDEATAKYLTLMRTALRECFDCNDKEVSFMGGFVYDKACCNGFYYGTGSFWFLIACEMGV